jgi:hypothetical protein
MKRLLYLLCLGILFSSCRKNGIEGLTGNYQTGQTAYISAPVMYVRNAIITDTATINTYLQYHNRSSVISYNQTETVADSILFIQFENDESARYCFGGFPNQFIMRPARKKAVTASILTVEDKDTTVVAILGPPPQGSRCDTVLSLSLKYGGIGYYTFISPNQPWLFKYLGRFPLIYENGELYLPRPKFIINNVRQMPLGVSTCMAAYIVPGLKVEGIEGLLSANDTLVFQDWRIKLVRQ